MSESTPVIGRSVSRPVLTDDNITATLPFAAGLTPFTLRTIFGISLNPPASLVYLRVDSEPVIVSSEVIVSSISTMVPSASVIVAILLPSITSVIERASTSKAPVTVFWESPTPATSGFILVAVMASSATSSASSFIGTGGALCAWSSGACFASDARRELTRV